MVIYEVNLTVQANIIETFLTWLTNHIKDMLRLDGFASAQCCMEHRDEQGSIYLTVRYTIETMTHLEHYFEHHAHQMREEGLQRFPNQFTATRRIFDVLMSL